jgi:acetolactate synthase-1/2/3 large subunit
MSYAAFGEAKYTNKLAVLSPTSGIGSINVLPGVLSAYCDSVPLLVISGNTGLKNTCKYIQETKNLKLRQNGVQDNNIIDMIKPITKYAIQIQKSEDILYELGKCCYLATSDRPGPVLIEIPSDIAGSYINLNELKEFKIPEENRCYYHESQQIDILKRDLQNYQRPLILAGGGIYQSNTAKEFQHFIEKYQIPFVHTFLGVDLVPYNNPLNLGNIGVKGKRNANFALQNCNYLLILGCALTTSHIGYLTDKFAYKAKKIAVDIEDTHKKDFVKLDDIINCDLRVFFKYML